jgi:hypothetical protein
VVAMVFKMPLKNKNLTQKKLDVKTGFPHYSEMVNATIIYHAAINKLELYITTNLSL